MRKRNKSDGLKEKKKEYIHICVDFFLQFDRNSLKQNEENLKNSIRLKNCCDFFGDST